MVRKADKLQDESYLQVARRLQQNLNALRTYHNLTFQELSRRTRYSYSYLHDVFANDPGRYVPSLDLLVKLADVFKTTPGKLLDTDLKIKESIMERLLEKKLPSNPE